MNLDYKLLDVVCLIMIIIINVFFLKILLFFGEVNIFLYIYNKLFNFCKIILLNFSIYVMIYNRFVLLIDLFYLCLLLV